jgi:hypothetical protein
VTYGCHNRAEFADFHLSQDGYTSSRPDANTRLPRMVKTPHVLTRDCQYTKTELGQKDAGCINCKHRK